jgi:hypothetical protein
LAQVKPEEIISDLSTEMRKALAAAAREILPGADFDERALFRAFKRAVARKCSTWEKVSDQHVRE